VIEIVANLHMHTPFSDGYGTHQQIAAAAARAGLHVVITTDHNVHVGGIEGYHNGVLLLVGEEVHDVTRRPQANHCLIYGADAELAPFARNPQTLIDAANARGGMAYFAHPIEYPANIGIENGAFGWHDWHVRNYVGIELWNYMTEFKSLLRNWPLAFVFGFMPSLGIRGPFPATLKLWDELLVSGKRVNIIGNSDAHALPFRIGAIVREIFSYDYLFRCVNTHLLLETALTGEVAHDKRILFNALRAGSAFIAYSLAGSARGFVYTAENGSEIASIGQDIRRTGMLRHKIRCPADADIRLLRNGVVVAQTTDRELTHQSIEPGAYRVEVRRRFRGLLRGWIFSNPIYVT
jgi:hypothetical protein